MLPAYRVQDGPVAQDILSVSRGMGCAPFQIRLMAP